MVLSAKNSGIMSRGPENWHFSFLEVPASNAPARPVLSTRQADRRMTGAGGHCKHKRELAGLSPGGDGADGSERINTD